MQYRPMLTLDTAPVVEAISTADLKEHLRISHSASDTYLAGLVDTVIAETDGPDGYLRRALNTQTWTASYRDFPRSTPGDVNDLLRAEYGRDLARNRSQDPWRLPIPPLQSVTSITYYDTDNALQTLSTDVYSVHTPAGAAGFIELVEGQFYPSVYDRADAVTVTFVAGYGDNATDVPARIRHALKMLAASLYTNRGDMVTERGVDPAILDRMLGPYRWREIV